MQLQVLIGGKGALPLHSLSVVCQSFILLRVLDVERDREQKSLQMTILLLLPWQLLETKQTP